MTRIVNRGRVTQEQKPKQKTWLNKYVKRVVLDFLKVSFNTLIIVFAKIGQNLTSYVHLISVI